MTTQTIRESQQRRFEAVSAFLAGLTDEHLDGVSYTISTAHAELIREDASTLAEAVSLLRDIIVDEYNHRQATLWNTQADLNGGHYLLVTLDGTELGKWQADCWPVWDGAKCWEGPNRDTVEEAIADAQSHCPEVEPEVYG